MRIYLPPGWIPRLLASTACLCFPPLMGSPMSSLRDPVSAFPRPVALTLPYSICAINSLSATWFSRQGVLSSLSLPTPSTHPLPPSVGLDRRTSTLPVPGGGIVFFFPLYPVCPPSPHCVPRRVLVSSEVLFLGCPFAQKLEA